MRVFLWFMLVMFLIEIFGKALTLHAGDDRRNLAVLPWEILVGAFLAIWAACLLVRG